MEEKFAFQCCFYCNYSVKMIENNFSLHFEVSLGEDSLEIKNDGTPTSLLIKHFDSNESIIKPKLQDFSTVK